MSPKTLPTRWKVSGLKKETEKDEYLLTETQGLDVALGVGDLWTVTNAIQAPGNGYLRGTGDAETDIIVSEEKSAARADPPRPLLLLLSLSLPL